MKDIILGQIFQLYLPLNQFDSELKLRPRISLHSAFVFRVVYRLKRIVSWFEWIVLNIWGLHVKMCSKSEYLVKGTVTVKRMHGILTLWNLVNKNQKNHLMSLIGAQNDSTEIEITLTCPCDCITGGIEFRNSTNSYRTFDSCELKDLNLKANVPIMIWFHGGGMAFGDSCDEGIFRPYLLFLRSRKKIIWLSVNYRLAPEHPFPAAIIDGLSVVNYLIENYPKSAIHVGGISADGNISAVVGLETFRRFPSAVKSIVTLDPMLDPRMHSHSHLVYKTSPFCPSSFLRYCWGVYLQLSPFYDEGSYKKALEEKWFHQNSDLHEYNNIRRLVLPMLDLPQNLDSEMAPYFIVKTSTNDGLRDEGLVLVKALQDARAHVRAYETMGSHQISLLLDNVAFDSMMKAWCELLFEI